jgi:rhodanese-related sulfurtransferase
MKTVFSALLMGFFIAATTAQIHQEDLEKIYASAGEYTVPDTIQAKYPKFDDHLRANLQGYIPVIAVDELKQKIERDDKFYLLDARPKEAYDISHIRRARRVGYKDFGPEKVWMLNRDTEIVVYCSVGLRSEQVGKYLQMMGFKNVRNLYGSIYEWANNDGEVVDNENQPTNRVFAEDKEKAKFLRKGKAVLPRGNGDDPFMVVGE